MFSKIFYFILDLLFPRQCLGCQKEGSFVCEKCFKTLPIQKSARCFFCQKRLSGNFICRECKEKHHPKIDGIFAASDWNNELLKEMIYRYKYSFVRELAIPLSGLMLRFLETNQLINCRTDKLTNWKTDELILVPVPLSRRRLIWRGFNQSKVLAEILGEELKIGVLEIIERCHYVFPQAEIKDRISRQKNIAGAFRIKTEFQPLNLKNKTLILIDDVSTTGATLNECAKTLKVLRPKNIFGLVVARG